MGSEAPKKAACWVARVGGPVGDVFGAGKPPQSQPRRDCRESSRQRVNMTQTRWGIGSLLAAAHREVVRHATPPSCCADRRGAGRRCQVGPATATGDQTEMR